MFLVLAANAAPAVGSSTALARTATYAVRVTQRGEETRRCPVAPPIRRRVSPRGRDAAICVLGVPDGELGKGTTSPAEGPSSPASSSSRSRSSSWSRETKRAASISVARKSRTKYHCPDHIQISGRPTNSTSSRARPRTSEIGTGEVSAVTFASPFVARVPSLLTPMTRCALGWSRKIGSVNTATRPSSACGSVSGAARMTSPTLMRGSIEPLCTTYGRQPSRIGSRVTAMQPPTNHSQARPTMPRARVSRL